MVKQIKLKKVEELSGILPKYDTVAMIDLIGIPSSTLQRLRKEHSNILIRMHKYCVISNALDKVNKGLEKIKENSKPKMPALILSNLSPFEISRIFDEFKFYAPPKAEKITPVDIAIPAGPTSLMPGPALVELNRLGVKTKIEGGKIIVREDKTVIKAGERVPESLTLLLPDLGVKPIKIKIYINKAWFKRKIYGKDELEIDLDKYKEEISLAYNQSLSLAYNEKIVIAETIPLFLSDGASQASSLAFNIVFLCKENKEILLNHAFSHAVTLATEVFKAKEEAISEELKKFLVEKMLL